MGEEPQGVHRDVRRPGRQTAAISSPADWSWDAESDWVSAISFGCSTRPTVAIAAKLHCTRYDCGSLVKCFPYTHIWDWDTHSTSLLTPLHQVYPQAVHPTQKLHSHRPPVISLFPKLCQSFTSFYLLFSFSHISLVSYRLVPSYHFVSLI